MAFKKVYRVMKAVDYNGQRERELFYTENEADAKEHYLRAKADVSIFAEKHGLKTFDSVYADGGMTLYAIGNTEGRPYTGAKAEFIFEDFCKERFLDLCEYPIF